MTCYNNIYNLCASCDNPFEYSQIYINNNSLNIIAKDKTTGAIYKLNEVGNVAIQPCDLSTESEAIDYQTCYQLYLKYCTSGKIAKSLLSSQIDDTTSLLNDTFNNISNSSIKTTGQNNSDILLSSSTEDLVHYGNIITLATLLAENNQLDEISPIIDISGNIHKLNQDSLFNIMGQYILETTMNYYIQQDLKTLLTQNNLDSVNNCDICSQKINQSSSVPSTNVDVKNDSIVDVVTELDYDITTTEPPGAPDPPTSVSGISGDTTVSLSWLAPTYNNGSSITDYAIQYSSNSGNSWTTFNDGVSIAVTGSITGLANNTSYIFRVAAINTVGMGNYSENSSAVIPIGNISNSFYVYKLMNLEYIDNIEHSIIGFNYN